jgi:hypothetical protein
LYCLLQRQLLVAVLKMELASKDETNIDNCHAIWDETECLNGCLQQSIASQEKFYKYFYPQMMAVVLRYTQDKDAATTILIE